jgi:hypothetical protein
VGILDHYRLVEERGSLRYYIPVVVNTPEIVEHQVEIISLAGIIP